MSMRLSPSRGTTRYSSPWYSRYLRYGANTRGGIVTEEVLRALSIPFAYARDPGAVGRQIQEAWTFSQSSLSPVALLLTRDLMED